MRVYIPVDYAIRYWRDRGVWGEADEAILRALVDEREEVELPTRTVREYIESQSKQMREDVVEAAYVLVDDDGLTAQGLEVDLYDYVLDGRGLSPYVALEGRRGESNRHEGERHTLNLITAAPGYIDVVTPTGTDRLPTQAARDSGGRSAHPSELICAKCFIALPASGVCDTCG